VRATKAYDGIKLQLHSNLTSALEGGEWSALCPSHFTSGIRTPGTHCRYKVSDVIYIFVVV